MRAIFYDNLVDLSPLMEELAIGLGHFEQEEVYEIIEDIVHHRIFEVILDELPQAHHENFLIRFYSDPNDHDLFCFLKFHSPQIEIKITAAALSVLDEIRQDLANLN